MQQSMQTEVGGATQNILTRTTRARSNNVVVSHPNASNPIALAAQQSGFASSAMLRTLYQS
jgi:hypothetical protein